MYKKDNPLIALQAKRKEKEAADAKRAALAARAKAFGGAAAMVSHEGGGADGAGGRKGRRAKVTKSQRLEKMKLDKMKKKGSKGAMKKRSVLLGGRKGRRRTAKVAAPAVPVCGRLGRPIRGRDRPVVLR